MRFSRTSFLLVSVCCILSSPSPAQGILLDSFDRLLAWTPIVSDGVTLSITNGPGVVGKSMVLDFAFGGGAGYAIAQKAFPLTLPKNYRFSFFLRGETPVNNFEFKLLDSIGNVFWIKKLNMTYPRDWQKITLKKRHLSFAWGPSGGGEIRRVAKIEFVVSAGSGGRGKVYVDEFRYEPLPDTVIAPGLPLISYSSLRNGLKPDVDEDGHCVRSWASTGSRTPEWLSVDFRIERELGGLVIDWDGGSYGKAYTVQYSDDGQHWLDGYSVHNGNGGRDYIPLPEVSARHVRLLCHDGNRGKTYAIRKIEFKPVEFTSTPNALFTAIASESRRGLFPDYYAGRQTYWTVVGCSGDTKEALIDETGAVEIESGGVRLEPFLFMNNTLLTRADGSLRQSLDRGYLPIPSVEWTCGMLRLSVRAFAAGEAGRSVLVVTYNVRNDSTAIVTPTLFVAVRPFQVLPPWQELNIVGGVSRIDSLREDGRALAVNGKPKIFPLTTPTGFGAAEFDQGDVTDYLVRGELPVSRNAHDHAGYASGAYRFDARVLPGGEQEFSFVIPFHAAAVDSIPTMTTRGGDPFVENLLERSRTFWETKVSGFDVHIPGPDSTIVSTVKSNLAYVFINRDGPAIQPGSRTYKRAWIRDGSLTSTALLQTGNVAEVRQYIDWYARYQFPSGKIPCVVDGRGADPVPENDSHGEFIFAVMQYFRYTRDTLWLRGKWGSVTHAVQYIKQLRRERMTEVYRNGTPEQRACFGLVPESISHEGYSAKPMHSYWDDFFVLRGLKDASEMAHVLGETNVEEEWSSERDDFRTSLYSSMKLAMTNTKVDFIPGCAELGDFDATSTSIGILPCSELGNIPEPQLRQTFEKYYEYFRARRDGQVEWANYTPYELRIVGAFVLLGWRERAHELLRFFLHDRRPPSWNHWAEVVWRERAAPRMIGDMPHTWVGTDYIRSIRSMFAYERDRDTALVVGAGIRPDWVAHPQGIRIRHLSTYYGSLDFSASTSGGTVSCSIGGSVNPKLAKIFLVPPIDGTILTVRVNGREGEVLPDGTVQILDVPSSIDFVYRR